MTDSSNSDFDNDDSINSKRRFNIRTHEFKEPIKKVKDIDAIEIWIKSRAYDNIISMLQTLSNTIIGIKLRDNIQLTSRMEGLLRIMDRMEEMVKLFPPLQQPQRFGNKAFRSYYEHLKKEAPELLKTHLEEEYHTAIPELAVYLTESIGNATRIDYGTGHELCFMSFIYVLMYTGYLSPEYDGKGICLRFFYRYTLLMRNLQDTYCMEPAGSHGVWCLDDFCFLPFYFGSSQLFNHPRLTPSVISDEDMVASFHKDYMFFDCVNHINKVKTGPFFEHSNQLWNISGVKFWPKINTGLLKMYKAEILNKYPVIQHYLFGSILTLELTCSDSEVPEDKIAKNKTPATVIKA